MEHLYYSLFITKSQEFFAKNNTFYNFINILFNFQKNYLQCQYLMLQSNHRGNRLYENLQAFIRESGIMVCVESSLSRES